MPCEVDIGTIIFHSIPNAHRTPVIVRIQAHPLLNVVLPVLRFRHSGSPERHDRLGIGPEHGWIGLIDLGTILEVFWPEPVLI